MVSSLSSFFLSFPREVIDILGGLTSGSQAGWDVIDLLGCLTDSAPVPMVMLVSLDGGWDVVYILWNRRLIVIVEIVGKVLTERDRDLWFEFGKVGWYIVGLLSDWLSIRDIFTDRRREVIDLQRERERNTSVLFDCSFNCLVCTVHMYLNAL